MKTKTKPWFALELMRDKQINPSMYRSTAGMVHLSKALARTNKNFYLLGFDLVLVLPQEQPKTISIRIWKKVYSLDLTLTATNPEPTCDTYSQMLVIRR